MIFVLVVILKSTKILRPRIMSARVLSVSSSTGPSPLDLRSVSASLAHVDPTNTSSSRPRFSAVSSSSRPRIIPSPTAVSRVRRCLFGARTAEEAFVAEAFAKHELQKIEEQDRTRWNFDFSIEKPLEGAYAWTAIVTLQSHPATRGIDADVDQSETPFLSSPTFSTSSSSASTSSSTSTSPNVSRRTSQMRAAHTKTKQLTITDFMRTRKRPSTEDLLPENSSSKRLCESN